MDAATKQEMQQFTKEEMEPFTKELLLFNSNTLFYLTAVQVYLGSHKKKFFS